MLFVTAALLTLALEEPVFLDVASLVARERDGEPPATAALLDALRALPAIHPPAWRELPARWSWALGDPGEGLHAPIHRLPHERQPVSLPHRALHPDTPYWYVTDITVTTPSALHLRADDGAHVWLDGERIPMTDGVFRLKPTTGPSRLVVRVLNKAVYGGLQGARIASQPDVDRFLRESRLRERLAAAVTKVRLLRHSSEDQQTLALQAVRQGSEDAIAAAEKAMATAPLTVMGPVVQTQSTERAIIVWETDVPCVAEVEWRSGEGPLRKARARSEGTLHVADLWPLSQHTEVRYRTRSGAVLSPEYRFRPLPENGPFSFAVWADSQNAWPVFARHVEQMRGQPLAFHVGVGDMVENGGEKGPWLGLFSTLGELAASTPTMLIGGNHEIDDCFEDLRSPHFWRTVRMRPAPSHYAWSAGNARFVALDPNGHFPTGLPIGSAEREWFLKEVESPAWKRATWRFVFIHQPPYSQGWADYHGDFWIREMLEPLVERCGIDFVVSGHTHDYERLTRTHGAQTVHYLIVGGAGGALEDGPLSAHPVMDLVVRRHHHGRFTVNGDRVVFEAVGLDGEVFDRLEARKKIP